MAEKRRVLEVNGREIRPGTSLFDAHTEEVVWYTGMRNGYVRLETLWNFIEMPKKVFRARIIGGSLHIESRPPAPQPQE